MENQSPTAEDLKKYIHLLENLCFFLIKEKIPYNVLVHILSKNEDVSFKTKVLENTQKHMENISSESHKKELQILRSNFS